MPIFLFTILMAAFVVASMAIYYAYQQFKLNNFLPEMPEHLRSYFKGAFGGNPKIELTIDGVRYEYIAYSPNDIELSFKIRGHQIKIKQQYNKPLTVLINLSPCKKKQEKLAILRVAQKVPAIILSKIEAAEEMHYKKVNAKETAFQQDLEEASLKDIYSSTNEQDLAVHLSSSDDAERKAAEHRYKQIRQNNKI